MKALAWILVVIFGIMAGMGAEPALHFGFASMFVVGAIGFWVLLGLCLVLITYNSDDSDSGNATATLFLSLLLFQLLTNFKPFNYILAKPLYSLGIAGAYIFIGFWWSWLGKWRPKVYATKAKYLECRADFCKKHKDKIDGNRIPDSLLEEWNQEVIRKRVGKPEARQYKAVIVGWMCYWPFSLVWTLLKDWLRKICDHIYEEFRHLYEQVANRAYKDTADDFRKPMPVLNVDQSGDGGANDNQEVLH